MSEQKIGEFKLGGWEDATRSDTTKANSARPNSEYNLSSPRLTRMSKVDNLFCYQTATGSSQQQIYLRRNKYSGIPHSKPSPAVSEHIHIQEGFLCPGLTAYNIHVGCRDTSLCSGTECNVMTKLPNRALCF